MIIRPLNSRKLSKRTVGAVLAVVLLIGYVGAYFVNLNEGLVIYTDSATERIQPSYVTAQEASEVVFWPAYQIHQRIDPARFAYDPSDPFGFAEFRDKWW